MWIWLLEGQDLQLREQPESCLVFGDSADSTHGAFPDSLCIWVQSFVLLGVSPCKVAFRVCRCR